MAKKKTPVMPLHHGRFSDVITAEANRMRGAQAIVPTALSLQQRFPVHAYDRFRMLAAPDRAIPADTFYLRDRKSTRLNSSHT